MSDYKFVGWVDIIYEKNRMGTKDFNQKDVENYMKDNNQPDLVKFIQHHTDEGFKALEAGIVDDHRWNRLIREIKQAANAISDKNTSMSLIAKAFYDLGRAREALDLPTHGEMADLYKCKVSANKREHPIFLKNLNSQHIKKLAKIIAQEKWHIDTEQKIRIGDMCKIVDTEIITNHKDYMDYLPENTNDMKKWLRPIAPDWAMKGGRPQKKHQEKT